MHQLRTSLVALSTFVALASVACGGPAPLPGAPLPTTTADAGTTAEASALLVKDEGTIVDYNSGKPLAGLTVTKGDVSAVTDDSGHYALEIPADVKLTATVSGTNYVNLFLAEDAQAGDRDRGKFTAANLTNWNLAKTILPSYDATKSVVFLSISTLSTCASAAGATIDVTSASGGTIRYFSSGLPNASLTSVYDEVRPNNKPAAVVYNVDPGVDLAITISHPTCSMIAFPATVQGVTYTGHVETKAGDASSSLMLWLQ
ncbi:MAG: hypothetical protein ACHREM_29180 [Polyangiales bacterium]